MTKQRIVFALHSWISIITNSSTEIFTTCHEKSVEMIKELIGSILKAANSNKTVDAVVTIRLFMERWGDDDKQYRDYENIDFNDDHGVVYMEIELKENNKDLSDLIANIFATREFAC